ncbi:MAG TPA: TatD family hydrolase [Candidatus Saccharimonadales bacterium]|nr:TatD family hydrolase [Candidatus Saccharimonadales bacterium]
MELVDTHCHIQSAGTEGGERITREKWGKVPGLTGDKMIADAAKDGVTRLLCVGCDGEDSRLAIDFVKNREKCWATVGIHPHEAQHYTGQEAKLAAFASLASEPKVVAIGECGLDYYYEHSPKEAQLELLRFQIELALKHDLPLIFHVREAFDDFWPIFDTYTGVRGVLHSFTDTAENLERAMERNLYVGVNGIATFAKNPKQLDVYRSIPLQKLLLETDAPFLTPTPYRGSINEPRRVRRIAEFVSEIRGESLEQIAQATTVNAQKLFAIT